MSSNKKEFTYTWIIENYSFCDKAYRGCLRSSDFTVDTSKGSKWSIRLYPRGNTLHEGFVSLHLHIADTKVIYMKEVDFNVELRYTDDVVFTLDGKNARTPPVCGRASFFEYFFDEVTKTDELEATMKKNGKDRLTLRCHFTLDKEYAPKENLVTRKVLGIDQFSFLLDVPYDSSPEWIVMKKLNILESAFEIIIRAPEDKVLIEIRKTGSNSMKYVKIKCKLTLLNREVSNGSVESVSDVLETDFLSCDRSSHQDQEVFNSDSLQFDLRNLLLSEKYADVTFRIGEVTISSHKNILASRSPVFSAMFDQDMSENKTGTIDISDVKSDILRLFLEFLYTNTLGGLDCKKALELLLVAEKYQVPSLKEECSQFLSFNFEAENICDVVHVADMLGHAVLKTSAIDYIKNHSSSILGSPNWVKWIKSNVELGSEILCKISN